jgi:hypothetical protein
LISLKEWAVILKKARLHDEMRARTEATVKAAEALFMAGERDAIAPVLRRIMNTGVPLYRMGVKTVQGFRLLAASEDEITVETACPVCAHLYPVKIKSWRSRTRECIAPCPKCSAFRLIDLTAIRKERSEPY